MNPAGVFMLYKKELHRSMLLHLPVIKLTVPAAELKHKWWFLSIMLVSILFAI